MPSEVPPPGTASAPPLSDWLRGALLVVGFAAFGWFLLNRYGPSGRFEPHRRLIREFLRAAQAQDSIRLRTLVSGEEPLRWALTAGTQNPWLLPDPDSALVIRGASRFGGAETVAVWGAGLCARRPYFVTVVGEGRSRRIEAVQTDCTAPSPRDSTVER